MSMSDNRPKKGNVFLHRGHTNCVSPISFEAVCGTFVRVVLIQVVFLSQQSGAHYELPQQTFAFFDPADMPAALAVSGPCSAARR